MEPVPQLHRDGSHGKQTPAQAVIAVGGEQECPWDTTANIYVIPRGLSAPHHNPWEPHDVLKSLRRGSSDPLAPVPVVQWAQNPGSQGKGTTLGATLASSSLTPVRPSQA